MRQSCGIISVAMTSIFLMSSTSSAVHAGDFNLRGQPAAPDWLKPRGIGANDLRPRPGVIQPLRPNFPVLPGGGGGGRPGNGVGGIHHPHPGGAIAAAAIGGLAIGAIAASAAAHRDYCQIAVYNRRGHFVGYRAGSCDEIE